MVPAITPLMLCASVGCGASSTTSETKARMAALSRGRLHIEIAPLVETARDNKGTPAQGPTHAPRFNRLARVVSREFAVGRSADANISMIRATADGSIVEA